MSGAHTHTAWLGRCTPPPTGSLHSKGQLKENPFLEPAATRGPLTHLLHVRNP